MPDTDYKPIKGIGGFHLPLIMEDKQLHQVTHNHCKDYGKHFTGRSKAKVNH
jgi:hypothetical protein